jgi:hypothetical protein
MAATTSLARSSNDSVLQSSVDPPTPRLSYPNTAMPWRTRKCANGRRYSRPSAPDAGTRTIAGCLPWLDGHIRVPAKWTSRFAKVISSRFSFSIRCAVRATESPRRQLSDTIRPLASRLNSIRDSIGLGTAAPGPATNCPPSAGNRVRTSPDSSNATRSFFPLNSLHI